MLRLILVRHAKSAWDDPGLADIDRPLAERGLEASAWIGDTLAGRGWGVDRVLCSPARRTRETLELALARMPPGARPGEVVSTEALYGMRDDDYIGLLRERDDDVDGLMLVGHNPATHGTALKLVGNGDVSALDALAQGYPTGAIAVIEFDVQWWRDIAAGSGQLVAFLKPPRE